jgi:hypothetical protein
LSSTITAARGISFQINCEVCTKTYAAAAAMAYQDDAKVSAALSDLETAAIEEPLRATLRMLRKLTREHAVDADDMHAVLAAGVSRQQIEDALAVCFTLSIRPSCRRSCRMKNRWAGPWSMARSLAWWVTPRPRPCLRPRSRPFISHSANRPFPT